MKRYGLLVQIPVRASFETRLRIAGIVCKAIGRRGTCPQPDSGGWVGSNKVELEFDDISGYKMSKQQAVKAAEALRRRRIPSKVTG